MCLSSPCLPPCLGNFSSYTHSWFLSGCPICEEDQLPSKGRGWGGTGVRGWVVLASLSWDTPPACNQLRWAYPPNFQDSQSEGIFRKSPQDPHSPYYDLGCLLSSLPLWVSPAGTQWSWAGGMSPRNCFVSVEYTSPGALGKARLEGVLIMEDPGFRSFSKG